MCSRTAAACTCVLRVHALMHTGRRAPQRRREAEACVLTHRRACRDPTSAGSLHHKQRNLGKPNRRRLCGVDSPTRIGNDSHASAMAALPSWARTALGPIAKHVSGDAQRGAPSRDGASQSRAVHNLARCATKKVARCVPLLRSRAARNTFCCAGVQVVVACDLSPWHPGARTPTPQPVSVMVLFDYLRPGTPREADTTPRECSCRHPHPLEWAGPVPADAHNHNFQLTQGHKKP